MSPFLRSGDSVMPGRFGRAWRSKRLPRDLPLLASSHVRGGRQALYRSFPHPLRHGRRIGVNLDTVPGCLGSACGLCLAELDKKEKERGQGDDKNWREHYVECHSDEHGAGNAALRTRDSSHCATTAHRNRCQARPYNRSYEHCFSHGNPGASLHS